MSSDSRQRADLGFDDAFGDTDPAQWTPPERKVSEVPSQDLKAIGEQQGFTSREPAKKNKPAKKQAPKKERTDQINFRAKVSTIDEFRALCSSQTPAWPMGFAFERAMAALKRELDKEKKEKSS